MPGVPEGGAGVNVTLMSCFSPAFWSSMFNVDTVEVTSRVRASCWPFAAASPSFLSLAAAKPDMYGPVWVAATLVFVIGAGANLASFLSLGSAGADGGAVSIWKYDFSMVTSALALVYAFVFGGSLALWLALQYSGVTALGITYLVCLLGYSLTPFVPAAVSV
jgi:hypothetical protein